MTHKQEEALFEAKAEMENEGQDTGTGRKSLKKKSGERS
jgi:hypothetical protein